MLTSKLFRYEYNRCDESIHRHTYAGTLAKQSWQINFKFSIIIFNQKVMCTGGSPSSNGSQAEESSENDNQEQQRSSTEQEPEQIPSTAIVSCTPEEVLADYGENIKLLTLNSQVAELLTIIRDKWVSVKLNWNSIANLYIHYMQKYHAKRLQILCRPANTARHWGVPQSAALHGLRCRNSNGCYIWGSEIWLRQLWCVHHTFWRGHGARITRLLPLDTNWKDLGRIGCQYTRGTRCLCTFSRWHWQSSGAAHVSNHVHGKHCTEGCKRTARARRAREVHYIVESVLHARCRSYRGYSVSQNEDSHFGAASGGAQSLWPEILWYWLDYVATTLKRKQRQQQLPKILTTKFCLG